MSELKAQEAARPIIKTPQELVHIKHKISLLQYKYWVLMLRAYREAYEEGGSVPIGDEQYCYMPMKRLAEYLGYEPKTADIERDLEAIRKEPIIFNVLEKDKQKAKTGRGFISEWYVSSNRVGVVFPPVIRQAIEQLDSRQSIFHLLNWSIFNSFSGKYEALIYKLCKDYIGVGKTPYMPLDVFRSYMGIKEDEYTEFKRLNQWVISSPIARINMTEEDFRKSKKNKNPDSQSFIPSDIEVKVEFKTETRKKVGLWFHVKPKNQSMMDFGDDPAFRFSKVTIALSQQKKYLEEKGAEQVELCIQRANEYGEKQEARGKPVDYGAIYRKAIEENWGEEYHSRKVREAEKVIATAQRKAVENKTEQTQRRAELEAEYQAERSREALKALTREERHAHAMAWADTQEGQGRAGDYDQSKGDFKDVVNRARFGGYLRKIIHQPYTPEDFKTWLKDAKKIEPAKLGLDG